MAVPEKYWRCPTRAAIDALAARFAIPIDPSDQSWEYTAADPSRLEEFLVTLEGDALTDDERFTLSETVMQCFEDLVREEDVAASEAWHRFVRLLRARPALHAHTLCYWASLDSDLEDAWHIASLVRPLWAELEPAVGKAG